MSKATFRRSQVITTWGPGALIDLPADAAIVAGLDDWTVPDASEEIVEPRLVRKLETMLSGVVAPKLYAPPAPEDMPGAPKRHIKAYRFPEWFLVQETHDDEDRRELSRRLVSARALDSKQRFDGLRVVPVRFVRACTRGHVDDLDWYGFVHQGTKCRRQLWLDEQGTSGDLGDLVVRCDCGQSRRLHEAAATEGHPLGTCRGTRPWLGREADEPGCELPSRLLIRTATNAYFSQVVSVLSIPEKGSTLRDAVSREWGDLKIVDSASDLKVVLKKPELTKALAAWEPEEILAAIDERRLGATSERPVKAVELEAFLAAPEGYGDDVPLDLDFHVRRLPDADWREPGQFPGVVGVTQVHRLREVQALVGFTRFEPVMPDIDGEYDTDVERASLAEDATWFPAVENRGEGLFLELDRAAVGAWMRRPAVQRRIDQLGQGMLRWIADRYASRPAAADKAKHRVPGGPYILLHTLSHLLIQSLSMSCGYPASSIRERIYSGQADGSYGLLLFTGSPDAEGTLGGLVGQGRHMGGHLARAIRLGALCSNDPICAQHDASSSTDSRWLHGAACHGCTLVAETSCEMRNEYLDRALVVPTLDTPDAAFFEA